MHRDLPTDLIDRRADARAVDEATVAGLAESIAAIGLINPIRVRAAGDRWEVVAGVHRLEAAKRLGLAEITALVAVEDDLHAELAMIDENLCRAELSPSDRARQTARRKAIYLELHPETLPVTERGGPGRGKTTDNLSTVSSFADATAAVTGTDARTVRRDAERGEKVIAEVLDMVRGTKLDTGAYLDKIKGLSPNDQYTAARRDLAHLRSQEREKAAGGIAGRYQAKPAADPLPDADAHEKQVAALMSAWNKASAEARQDFLSRIDTPVFDRGAA